MFMLPSNFCTVVYKLVTTTTFSTKGIFMIKMRPIKTAVLMVAPINREPNLFIVTSSSTYISLTRSPS